MSALGDLFISSLQELLRILFTPIEFIIERYGPGVVRMIVGTPHPTTVFGPPGNEPWTAIYGYYWEAIMPLTLSLYGLMVGVVIFLESTSYLFGGYHRSKLKKRAFTGLLGILSWWWIAALSLQLIAALSAYLTPDLEDIALFQTLSFSAMGVLGLTLSLSVDLVLVIAIVLIYLSRQLALFLFVLLMPILIVFWIPGVGPFALVSRFMTRLAGLFFPLLFMTVPVALLFRLGALLGESLTLSMEGFGSWLMALLIPLAAVLSPFVLFRQASSLFHVFNRASQHASAERASQRASSLHEGSQTAVHGGRNFRRGLRGDLAVSKDGQYRFGGSRAHAAGSRLNRNSSSFHGSSTTQNHRQKRRSSQETGSTSDQNSGSSSWGTGSTNDSTGSGSGPNSDSWNTDSHDSDNFQDETQRNESTADQSDPNGETGWDHESASSSDASGTQQSGSTEQSGLDPEFWYRNRQKSTRSSNTDSTRGQSRTESTHSEPNADGFRGDHRRGTSRSSENDRTADGQDESPDGPDENFFDQDVDDSNHSSDSTSDNTRDRY